MIPDDNHIRQHERNVPLIVHHGNCPDGYGAAWWLGRHLGLHEKWGAGYNDKLLPDFGGRDVYVVDFCYPAEVMTTILAEAHSLRVLDHHETALGILKSIDGLEVITDYLNGGEWWNPTVDTDWAVLDQNHSGAGLVGLYVWDRWRTPPPGWFANLEDRDLWNFENKPSAISMDTPAIFAAITSHPYTDEAWEALLATPFEKLLNEGLGIERYRQQLIAKIIETKHLVVIGTDEVWAVAAPYAVGSDVAHQLCLFDPSRPFAAYYVVNDLGHGDSSETRPMKLQFGLRSLPAGANVATIARSINPTGGGHPHAAGFNIEL